MKESGGVRKERVKEARQELDVARKLMVAMYMYVNYFIIILVITYLQLDRLMKAAMNLAVGSSSLDVMIKYLLSLKPGLYVFSDRFNQDPLEHYFGVQRGRCGRSDNPNTRTFLYTEQAIRVQRTLAISFHQGNVRKRSYQLNEDTEDLSRPLKKRPQRSLTYKK